MPWPNANYRRECNLANSCTKSIMVGRHGGERLGIRQKSLVGRQTDRMRDHSQEGWLLSYLLIWALCCLKQWPYGFFLQPIGLCWWTGSINSKQDQNAYTMTVGQSAIHPISLQNDELANTELGKETLQSPSPAEEKGILAPWIQPMLHRVSSSLCLLYVCVSSPPHPQ